ncbi:ABC transporter ATP-binding protein [candidate division KSB1 bacterium]
MILELKNVEKIYKTPSGNESVTILNDLSLSVDSGKAIAVVGPSGSGKSTLLNIIGAIDKPTSGSVLIDGKDISALNETELADIRNSKIGFVFQLHHLLPHCTVLENVLIPTIPQNKAKNTEEFVDRAKKLLKSVGLADHMDYFPAQLSGGEQQRTAVVRALINRPKLVLADEPTGSLDRSSAENLCRILIDINKAENVTLIMVTHSLDLAYKLDTVYNLKDGRLELQNRTE